MNTPTSGRVLIGIYLLIIGAFALLDNLGIVNTRDVLQFWPLVFVGVGVLKLNQARGTSGYVIGGGFILVGIMMTLHQMGIIYFRVRDWWPMILIVIGLSVIFKHRFHGCEDQSAEQTSNSSAVAIMSGNKIQNSSQDFRGGELTAVMGGIELDLRGASIREEAVLNVFSFWGGIELKIPNDWTVETRAMPIMGGIDDKSVPPATGGKRLIITGTVIMGGVEIIN